MYPGVCAVIKEIRMTNLLCIQCWLQFEKAYEEAIRNNRNVSMLSRFRWD